MTPEQLTALEALRTTINAAVDRTDATRLVLSRLQDNVNEFEALLNKPPEPPKPVNDKKPRISKSEFSNVAGVTITTDSTPSIGKDARTRDLLKLCGSAGFNTARWLTNHAEAAAQLKLFRANSPDCLVTVARAAGLTPVADTVELMVTATYSDAALKLYFGTLKELGCAALYVNDADRKALAGTLDASVARIRAASDLPLVASIQASSDIGRFKKLFDWVEVQTFGTVDEFKKYVGLPADVWCIDGRRGYASAAFLNAMLPVLLDAKKSALMVYTALDETTNWQTMPDVVTAYRAFLAKWWQSRGA